MECPLQANIKPCGRLWSAARGYLYTALRAAFVLLLCSGLAMLSGCSGQSEEAVAETETRADWEADADAEAGEQAESEAAVSDSAQAGTGGSLPPGAEVSSPAETIPADAAGAGVQKPTFHTYSKSSQRNYAPKDAAEVTESTSRASLEAGEPAGEASSPAPGGSMAEAPSMAEFDPTGVPDASEVEPVEKAARESQSLAEVVQVFFATDRLPTQEVLPSMSRTFLPALALGCLGLAALSGAFAAKRWRGAWLGTAVTASLLGILALQISLVRWQQYSRLASNASTRFSVLRFEPDEHEYPLHVGLAEVSLPPGHLPGKFERPSLLRLEFAESPDRHIMLQRVEVDRDVDQWFGRVAERSQESASGDGFLFVHGYNVKFADALKRTAQLASDLQVQGPAISYSWPSRGQVAGYAADEATVSWAVPNFERLIVDLVQRGSVRRLNIVAHSMGNRALLESIERIYLRGQAADSAASEKLLGSLILAAPDVDAQRFRTRSLEAIQSVSENVVLYFSSHDRALQLSQGLHAAPRLGLGQLPASLGLEAVDTGRYGLFSLGHAYYGSDPVVLDDMRRVLHDGQSASQRPYLKPARTEQGVGYWEIDRERHARLQGQSQAL